MDALDHAGDAPDSQEQVCRFVRGEVRDAGDDAARRDEDVAWEDGFEVDEGKGKGGLVEDLFGSLRGFVVVEGEGVAG
jgi:hypothetical protein